MAWLGGSRQGLAGLVIGPWWVLALARLVVPWIGCSHATVGRMVVSSDTGVPTIVFLRVAGYPSSTSKGYYTCITCLDHPLVPLGTGLPVGSTINLGFVTMQAVILSPCFIVTLSSSQVSSTLLADHISRPGSLSTHVPWPGDPRNLRKEGSSARVQVSWISTRRVQLDDRLPGLCSGGRSANGAWCLPITPPLWSEPQRAEDPIPFGLVTLVTTSIQY